MSEENVPELRLRRVELELRPLVDAAAEHVAHQQHGAARLQRARRQQLRVPRHVRYHLQQISVLNEHHTNGDGFYYFYLNVCR